MPLGETQRLLREQFRKYLAAELEPITATLEAGEELPYPFLRKMVGDLGLGEPLDEAAAEDPELAPWSHTLLMVEIGRINPGVAMSYGTSADLCAGNVSKLGTAEQIERYVPALLRAEKIGAWCLTKPEAGSDAFRSMKTVANKERSRMPPPRIGGSRAQGAPSGGHDATPSSRRSRDCLFGSRGRTESSTR